MSHCDEKQRSISIIVRGIKQLKLDHELNKTQLLQYEKQLNDGKFNHTRQSEREWWRKLLLFITNAPAKLQRKLGKRLLLLARRLLLTIQEAKWRLPRFLIGDSVRFEDALGRRHNLPFPYFRHWNIFKAYVEYSFRNLPGGYQVRRDMYRLLHGQSGKTLGSLNWTQDVQSGQHVSMAVIATTSLRNNLQLSCTTCNSLMAYKYGTFDSVKCGQCEAIFKMSEAKDPTFVTPSDGYRKKSERNGTVLTADHAYADVEPLQAELTQDQCQFHDQPQPQPLQENKGLSQLKHIVLHLSCLPSEIANSIEELLDELITAFPNSRRIHEHETEPLRNALNLIRHEASITDELNYLDLKHEHREFMSSACELERCLKNNLHKSRDINEVTAITTATSSQIIKFCRWVQSHYPIPSVHPDSTPQDGTLVLIKTLGGSFHAWRVPGDATVKALKMVIEHRQGILTSQQYLVYKGRKLEDNYTMAHYNMGPQYYIHILLPIWYAKK